jgi:SAM-dependent methyltransferase
MFQRVLAACRVLRLREVRTFNPSTHGLYQLGKEIVVPAGQAIYDPKVFGRYDLVSQRVVPKADGVPPELWNLDLLMAEAQRYVRDAPVKLETDRYSLTLSLLSPGRGLCLDACTNQPLERVRESVSALGYEYTPIDLHGDGQSVRIEDVTRLSFSDRSVARILSLDTLEHIEDYKRAIAELYRVLAEDGCAFFHVPCYYFEKANSEPIAAGVDPWGHVRYFSARELIGALAEAGFIILRVAFQLDYGAVLVVCAKRGALVEGLTGR